MSKQDELCSLISDCLSDILVLTETWLSPHILDNEVLQSCPEYKLYRHDRPNRRGGGVLIGVRGSIQSVRIDTASCSLEMCWIHAKFDYSDFLLGVFYRPPDFVDFVPAFSDVLSLIRSRFPNKQLVILGDFNYPGIEWNIPYGSTNEESSFIDTCLKFGLCQLISEPTRVTSSSSSLLDLILTTDPDLFGPISFPTSLSDHKAIYVPLRLTCQRNRPKKKTIRLYDKANFDAFNQDLSLFFTTFQAGFLDRPVELNWSLFRNKLNDLVDRYIPSLTVTPTSNHPWFTKTLKRLSNKKKRLFRQAKKMVRPLHLLIIVCVHSSLE